jgi:hypothetical protein
MMSNRPEWNVVESAMIPKQPLTDGEDRFVLTHDGAAITRCAVVDGATDKSGETTAGGQEAHWRRSVSPARSKRCLPTVIQWMRSMRSPDSSRYYARNGPSQRTIR